MTRVHVFAIDWVPEPGDVAGGGGLRSLQVIEALRSGGHTVSVSVPRASKTTQAMRLATPERLEGVKLHDEANQIDLLRQLRPDVVLWLWPSICNVPFTGLGDLVHVCDLNGVQDHEIAGRNGAMFRTMRRRLVEVCGGADLVLTGSPEQHGYWLGVLGDAGRVPPARIIPYRLVRQWRQPADSERAGGLARLHVTGNLYHWNASTALLARVARWAGRHGGVEVSVVCGLDPGGGTALSDVAAMAEIARMPGVTMHNDLAFRATMASYRAGSLHLDLYLPSFERDLAVPIRTVNALSHGVPVLTNVNGPFARTVAQAGAAMIVADDEQDWVEAALDRVAALPPQGFAALATAARRYAEDALAPEEPAENLLAGISEAIDRRRRRVRGASLGHTDGPGIGHVLVITGESPNLRDLRVDLPFGVLHHHRAIAGYAVWRHGRIDFSTRADAPDPAFDAIWVQRSVSGELALMLAALQRPFVYDIDDNLLVSPAYRAAFSAESQQAVRSFVRTCTVLSCSTARLAANLQRHAATHLVGKTVVTENLARPPSAPPPIGAPNVVIWSSSDSHALTESLAPVVRAIRDFCLSQRLRLMCLGSPPPAMLAESDVEIEHLGMLPYPRYLDLLHSLAPAIMVSPLETAGEPVTQSFIDGKSDIKMLEALATGVVGVFSAARPYLDSGLPQPILCDNTYRSWFDGLLAAQRACGAPGERAALPAEREAGPAGVRPWFEAIARVRLAQPLRLAEMQDYLRWLRGRLTRRLVGPEEFDEDFYLAKYPDVKYALDQGTLSSAYEHYRAAGYLEKRAARDGDMPAQTSEAWWANLLHTISDLHSAVEGRGAEIEDLKMRRIQRLRLRRSAILSE